MIDLHSHILPGIDDGPATLEKSMELAVSYERNGFSRVVATPHWIPGTAWTPPIQTIQHSLFLLNEAIQKKSMNLRVLEGMEIAMDDNIDHLLADGQLLTLAGGPYVLVEPPFQRLPLGWKQMIFSICAAGYRVILAHPERCRHFFSHPELLDEMVEAGVYLQANVDSFLGHFGHEESKSAFNLLEKGYLHLLATDSHDSLLRHPGNFLKTLDVLKKTIDTESIENLTRTNPERVVSGLELTTSKPSILAVNSRKKWWFF